MVFLVGLAGGRVVGVLLVKPEGETTLGLKVECAGKRRRQSEASGFEEHEHAFDLLLNKALVATETLGLADFVQVMAIQPNEQWQDAGRGNAGRAEVALGYAGALELEFVGLGLGGGEDGEEATAVIGGVLGVGN